MFTEIDTEGNLYLSADEWKKYIVGCPKEYKHIPPHRFGDVDFVKMINNHLFTNFIRDLDSLEERYKQAVNDEERQRIKEEITKARAQNKELDDMIIEKNKTVIDILDTIKENNGNFDDEERE